MLKYIKTYTERTVLLKY